MKYFITHAGESHLDDLLTSCILISSFGLPVHRRNPSTNELNDDHILVFDIGRSYDADKLNFDHHQDASLPCSFHLVFGHFWSILPEMASIFPWFKTISDMDTKGPGSFGVDPKLAVSLYINPIHQAISDAFERSSIIDNKDPLFAVLAQIGAHFMSNYFSYVVNRNTFESETTIEEVSGIIYAQTFMTKNLSQWLSWVQYRYPQIEVFVRPDMRDSTALSVMRKNDSVIFDSRKVSKAVFAHKNGFLYTIKPEDLKLSLIEATKKL